jgi:type II secretory pathway predicted ATPase ExeA
MSSQHALALSILEYSLAGQAGFCAITGEIGSGKTTLIRTLLRRIGRDTTVGLISNTHSGLTDITAWALAAFGREANTQADATIYQELMHFLIDEYGAGRRCVLIVDEAQNLTIDALEELRLLSNINSDKDLLLQVILVGQPELLTKLRKPELRQFAQRVSLSYHLPPLTYLETRHYIRHRLEIAGSHRAIFTDAAIGLIHYFSGGVPRVINGICVMALVYGLGDDRQEIELDLVQRVISDRQASGVSPFVRDAAPDDPAVVAEVTGMVREALELRAVSGEEEPAAVPVAPLIATDEEPAFASATAPLAMVPNNEEFPPVRMNERKVADNYPFLEVPRTERRPAAYRDVRIDPSMREQYRGAPEPDSDEEPQRDSWFRRTFRRTS